MHLKGEWEREIVRKIDQPIHTRISRQLRYISTNQFLKKHLLPPEGKNIK